MLEYVYDSSSYFIGNDGENVKGEGEDNFVQINGGNIISDGKITPAPKNKDGKALERYSFEVKEELADKLARIDKLAKKQETPAGVLVGLTMITAGAMGNIIDCFFYGLIWPETVMPGAPFAFMFGQVVDMFYFPLFDYKLPWMDYPRTFFGAVFNFADSCVTCGAIYLMLFQWKFFSSEEKSK